MPTLSEIITDAPLIDIPLADIIVGDRMRKDYGDVNELAMSIDAIGLQMPLLLNHDNTLIAGGRRYTAVATLGWISVPAKRCLEQIPQSALRLLELEENRQRQTMTWFEESAALYDAWANFNKENPDKSKREFIATVTIMGPAVAYQYLNLGEAIYNGRRDLIECASKADALRKLTAEQSAIAAKMYMDFQRGASTATVIVQQVAPSALSPVESTMALEPVKTPMQLLHEKPAIITVETFESHFTNLDIREIAIPPRTRLVYSDIPYGIDMENLNNVGLDTTKKEHKVDDNVALFEPFVALSRKALGNQGWLVFWYDLEHHQKLIDILQSYNFRVCRWPIVWSSPSGANQAPYYNPTKVTEVCMVAAYNGPQIIKPLNNHIHYHMLDSERAIYANPNNPEERHPFVKPYEVHRLIIESFTLPGEVIYDPYAGRGSIPRAAWQLNRPCYGNELVPEHFSQCKRVLTENYSPTKLDLASIL